MLTLEMSVSGGQLGRKLAEDVEELWYGLEAMAEELSERDIEEMAEYANSSEDVIAMLEKMAAALKGADDA
jgi:hypothetical protein